MIRSGLNFSRHAMLFALSALTVHGLAGAANAQAGSEPGTVLPGRPDVDGEPMALDPPFISSSAGISVRSPVDGKMIRRGGAGDEIVRFVNDQKKWQMIVSRFLLTEPMPLITRDPKAAASDPKLIGFVDSVLSQIPGGESIDPELVPISGYDAALLKTRARDSTGDKLIQHAIIRRSDKVYYVVAFTVPVSQEELGQDPQAVSAIKTFEKIADSIELLDQEQIARDQTERLLRTRALMVNWNQARLESALMREQWLRLIKDDKDIGYTYIIEEPANDLPRAGKASAVPEKPLGVRVGVRSRTMPSADFVVDAESWMWVSYPRNQEAFSNLLMSRERGREANYAMERGTAIRRDREVPVVLETPNTKGERIESRKDDKFELQIWSTSKKQTMPPLTRQLPPFYLPQALGQLLPRLLPLSTPTSYMWASYVSETRSIMTRYVDVLPAATVTFGGSTFTAVPVQERMGLEGSITTHYITPEGLYRGSVNEENKISIVPSDEATIRSLWKDANLARPSDVDEKK